MNAIKARDLAWKALLAEIKKSATQGDMQLYFYESYPQEFYAELINLGYKAEGPKLEISLLKSPRSIPGRISW